MLQTAQKFNHSRALLLVATLIVIALSMIIWSVKHTPIQAVEVTVHYVGLALCVLSLVLMAGLLRVQQKQVALRARIQQLLKDENSRLETMVQARTQALSDLASHLTQAREEERQRIARELHDQMGAWLTAANMDAQHLKRTAPKGTDSDTQARLDRLAESIGRTIKLGRRLVDELHPPLLEGLGLEDALRVLAQEFELDVPVRLDLPNQLANLDKSQALALYRIAQESFNNVRKYARADQVNLRLWMDEHHIHLSIEDDGVGFDLHAGCRTGHGIAGMRHRTQMFKGRLEVQTAKGQGTRIEACIPLRAGEHTLAA